MPIQPATNADPIVMFTQEGGTYGVHSNHPRIGTSHSPDLKGLRRTVRALIDTLPEDVRLVYATSIPSDALEDDSVPEGFLAADQPDHAYETVGDSERLPPAERTERGDGRASPPATAPFRADPSVSIVGVGHVTSAREH